MSKSICLACVILFALGLAICARQVVSQDTVDLTWKARALQAMEKIEQVSATLKANPEAGLSLKAKLETMVEFAYAQIIANRDFVVKRGPSGVSYHLVFNYGERGMLDVFYTYVAGKDQCVAVTIARLPKGYGVAIPSNEQGLNAMFFTNMDDPNEPSIVFHRDNPFLCGVVGSTATEANNPDKSVERNSTSGNQSRLDRRN